MTETFRNGGNFAGAGSSGSSRGSLSRSPLSISQGGGKLSGSAGYSSLKPYTFTGGSFGGHGKYGVGYRGKSNYNSSFPSSQAPMYGSNSKKSYGKINKHITQGIPSPIIGNKYDNVNRNKAYKIKRPKYPYGYDARDKNLTGYYGYSGYGYGFDPWYWGYGPYWTINNNYLNYPDIPFDYETLMQQEIDADNSFNTVQNQIAEQLQESETISEQETKEDFKAGHTNCYKNTILTILAVVLIIYLLLTMSMSDTEKSFSFDDYL